jgi:hypothetical protein
MAVGLDICLVVHILYIFTDPHAAAQSYAISVSISWSFRPPARRLLSSQGSAASSQLGSLLEVRTQIAPTSGVWLLPAPSGSFTTEASWGFLRVVWVKVVARWQWRPLW